MVTRRSDGVSGEPYVLTPVQWPKIERRNMEILNKTPHILRFYDQSERIVVGEVRPEPRAARVFVRRERVEDMPGGFRSLSPESPAVR